MTVSRLESFGGNDSVVEADCRVRISQTTRELVGGAFEVKYVGEVPLKGEAGNFMVFQALGAAVHRGEEDHDAR